MLMVDLMIILFNLKLGKLQWGYELVENNLLWLIFLFI